MDSLRSGVHAHDYINYYFQEIMLYFTEHQRIMYKFSVLFGVKICRERNFSQADSLSSGTPNRDEQILLSCTHHYYHNHIGKLQKRKKTTLFNENQNKTNSKITCKKSIYFGKLSICNAHNLPAKHTCRS